MPGTGADGRPGRPVHARPAVSAARGAVRAIGTALLALLVWLGPAIASAAPEPKEYELKAAFLYNFARFAEWPPSAFAGPHEPIVICVLGRDPFGPILDDTVYGKSLGPRRFDVRRIASAAKADGCHIVFIAASALGELDAVLAALHGKPVMTVADIEDAARRGAVLSFALRNGRVRFIINANAAKRAGLVLSSQLIKVASAVISDAVPP